MSTFEPFRYVASTDPRAELLGAATMAYVMLLQLPMDHPLRASMQGQRTLAGLVNAIAGATGRPHEEVQTSFEQDVARMQA